MSNIAVKVEGLSKQYRIGKQERYRTFRDTIADALTAPARRVAGLLRGNASAAANLTETIWALRDISFEVKHGEVVGIIGRNGAGKSTLLKILSRITEPTEGTIDIFGRVGALLEVGTGFHPELTGRENVYLNGAILGMSREDIRRKFDEIVDFAGVEQFIDTPVKHYSSGMGLRLGFAVAAHLEPDILIVDEVLAVGDAEFQKKCMGKMSDVAGEGRTVLFVSHNMAAVSQLCPRSILLKNGSNFKDDSTERVVRSYLEQSGDIIGNTKDLTSIQRNRTTHKPMLQRIALRSEGQLTTKFVTFGELTVEVECSLFSDEMKAASLGIVITNALGTRVLVSHFDQYGYCKVDRTQTLVFVARITHLVLAPGSYRISLHLSDGLNDVDTLENVIGFDVEWNSKISVKYPPRPTWGDVFVDFDWSVSPTNT